jgi:hypothetical protein
MHFSKTEKEKRIVKQIIKDLANIDTKRPFLANLKHYHKLYKTLTKLREVNPTWNFELHVQCLKS